MAEPAETPEPVKKTGGAARGWIIALLIAILVVLVWPTVSDWMDEAACDGRIQTHQMTGRRICDRFPFGESLAEMDFDSPIERQRDYWIDR